MKQFFRPKHFLVCDIMRDIFALRWKNVCVKYLVPFFFPFRKQFFLDD